MGSSTAVPGSWNRITRILTVRAPATAKELLPPATDADVRSAERALGRALPQELHEWWASCGGGLHPVLPHGYIPYRPIGSVSAWREWTRRHTTGPRPDDTAGSPGAGWHPAFVPIGTDGGNYDLAVDLRPGSLHGCLFAFSHQWGVAHPPEWQGLAALLSSTAEALETDAAAGRYRPATTRAGMLIWKL
ncbi:SMI1/KNR4 family protein [Allokutzneria sp. NRRL B-24872]|uniref:SMI1/KNR4 family protein n=1 Tax=Allokutzneria sp. NRRL B-24872 TaxID=1137961 RepID=UPI00143D2EE9|nr:SMI1/KNR4 family protein [Allokutzneria sp. NRRL B-24872]